MSRYISVFLLSLTISDVVTVTSSNSNKFLKTAHNNSNGPARLSPSWIARSRSNCASNCQSRFSKKCRSFMYSAETKLCTPAMDLVSYCPPPTVTEGDLYLCDGCPPFPTFSVYVNGSTKVSYMYITNFTTYADATVICNSFNAHLFIPDTMEKFGLFSSIIDTNYYTWVGLDDRNEEGKFVWANSGLEVDAAFKTLIFTTYQSYGNNGVEDCVYYVPLLKGFNDGACTLTMRFVCEKSGC